MLIVELTKGEPSRCVFCRKSSSYNNKLIKFIFIISILQIFFVRKKIRHTLNLWCQPTKINSPEFLLKVHSSSSSRVLLFPPKMQYSLIPPLVKSTNRKTSLEFLSVNTPYDLHLGWQYVAARINHNIQ